MGLLVSWYAWFSPYEDEISHAAPWQSPWKLSEAVLRSAGIEAAAATLKRNRPESLKSVSHKDLLPIPWLTGLFSHPNGAEDRRGKQMERAVRHKWSQRLKRPSADVTAGFNCRLSMSSIHTKKISWRWDCKRWKLLNRHMTHNCVAAKPLSAKVTRFTRCVKSLYRPQVKVL